MLMIASESLNPSERVNDVVREMSLALVHFRSATLLAGQLGSASRGLLLLAADDLTETVVEELKRAKGSPGFGIILAADSKQLRKQGKSQILDVLTELPNVEWVGPDFDTDRLMQSARRCRRRMLRISESELNSAFDKFEFVVQYQPKVQRGSSQEWLTQEAEALVRWRHPEHGLLAPLEFLPEIEAFEMMGRLTEFVLRKAAAQLLEWEKQGLFLRACVNLASSQLGNQRLGDHYAAVVGEFGLPCDRFTFEVVERDLADRDAPQMRALANMREAGFRLCLDNFKVAAASLGTLEVLPFDEIKIHASTLRRARENEVARKVLAAVTGLAHSLEMSVCAEGVEDEETFQFLKTIGCDKMQGFLVSEAVMPHILKRVYARHNEAAAESV